MTMLDLAPLRSLSQRLADLLGDDAPATLRAFRFNHGTDSHDTDIYPKADRRLAVAIDAVAIDLFAAAPTNEPNHPAWDALLSWRQASEFVLSKLPRPTAKLAGEGR